MRCSRQLAIFYLGCAVLNLGANTAHPVTPTIFTTLGLGSYMFGVALASQLITNFLFSPFWGRLSAYISSRTALLITCMGYAGGQVLFGLARTEAAFVAARALTGIFCGGCFVCIMTYVVNTAPDPISRGQQLTATATIQMVFSAFGYLLGGLLGEVFTYLAIIVQVLCLAAAGLIFYFGCRFDAVFPLSDLRKKGSEGQFNPFGAFAAAGAFLTPLFSVLFAMCLLQNLGFTAYDQTFNYYIRDQFGFSSGYNGVLKGLMGLITLAANSTVCIFIIRRTQIRRSVIWVLGACSLTMLAGVLFDSIAPFVTANVLYFACNSISLPVLQDLVANDVKSAQHNLVMGFYNAMKSLGGIVGALLAGLLYTASPKAPFVFGCAAFALATALAVLYKRGLEGQKP